MLDVRDAASERLTSRVWRSRWAVGWWRALKEFRAQLQIFDFVVHSRNGVVLDKDRYSRHAKGDEDGYAGGKASDQRNAQRSKKFAKKVNPPHLRIQLCQRSVSTTNGSNGKLPCRSSVFFCDMTTTQSRSTAMVLTTDESFSTQARKERNTSAVFADHESREVKPECSRSHNKMHDAAVAVLCPTESGQLDCSNQR